MKNTIRIKLSELKQIIKNTIEEQQTNQFLNPYQTLKGDDSKLKCIDPKLFNQKGSGGKMYLVYDNPKVGPNAVAERVVLYNDGTADIITNGGHNMGKWSCGTKGVEYRPDSDSKSVRVLNVPKMSGKSQNQGQTQKPQINVANCAGQLVDVVKGKNKILKFGCKTQAVKELQTLLNIDPPTGYFGNTTLDLVKKIQEYNKIKVDGIVGPETYPFIIKSATTQQKSDDQPIQYQFT
jgi:hypothetical protein